MAATAVTCDLWLVQVTAATASWGTGESAPLGAQIKKKRRHEDVRKLSAQQLAHIWPAFAFVAGLLVSYWPLGRF